MQAVRHNKDHSHMADDYDEAHEEAQAERERRRARRIVENLMYVPSWALGALVLRVQQELRRSARVFLLEPNKYSDLKVERYTFAVNALIEEMGKPQVLTGSNSPDVNFRPQRVTANVTGPAVVMLGDARVANVSFIVGGEIDAWQCNPHAVGQDLDVPTLTPANKASFSGRYTGRVTPDMQDLQGKKYLFSMAFTGPASIVA